jgi:DNA (cytosine-5)-methyltransferase 1
MIEFFLRHNPRNIKGQVQDLLEELEMFFQLEGIKVANIGKVIFPSLKGKVSEDCFDRVNAFYNTIEVYKERFPFLANYMNKSGRSVPKSATFVDLFAGCGGLSLGLENAGFHPVFVNEIEPSFAETYYFNHTLHADRFFVGDINQLIEDIEVYANFFKEPTLVCGGPPCQGFSMANRQRLIDDPRNRLYKAYLLFLHEVRPRFFILENVKGMSQKIKEIVADFKRYMGDDYDIHYTLLNARDFGVPQNRERFFLIGNRAGISSTRIFKAIESQAGRSFVLKDAIAGLPELQPKPHRNNNTINNDAYGSVMRRIKAGKERYSVYINGDSPSRYIFNHKNRYNNERDVEIFGRLPQGANSLHPSIRDIMPYKRRNHMFKDKYFKLSEAEVCKTITSHMKFDCNMYIHPTQARGLSPREAARVQTFPDRYFFRGSHNRWYAQIGNAVPVKLAESIGRGIKEFL